MLRIPLSLLRILSIAALAAHALGSMSLALAGNTAAPPNAEAKIIWPPNGAVLSSGNLWVRMGLRNMGVAPKGVVVPNTGHHHLLIDTEIPALDQPIPNDRNHLHFGAGETEARVELPPGKHTLQLLMGDHEHVPHNPPIKSKKISVTVK